MGLYLYLGSQNNFIYLIIIKIKSNENQLQPPSIEVL
jgi:hypothetical protein